MISWTFDRIFYGSKKGIDLKQVRDYLMRGYCFIPYTPLDGWYKAIVRVGDHDKVYERIEKPFPDILLAQKPDRKFALLLSGGHDSSILAWLYDREDADYIHFSGPETVKVRALAEKLRGRVHEIQLTPQMFISAADELVHRLDEPYAFEDVVYSYIASRKARELGHTLVVAGDGGGVWGGSVHHYSPGPYSRKGLIAWKTIGPNRLLGLETLQPLMHSGLYAWSKATDLPCDPGVSKPLARDYARQLGMPEIVVRQKKVPWAGSMNERTNEQISSHLGSVVDGSGYRWVREFRFSTKVQDGLLFRQYSLVRWLQANYRETLPQSEIEALQRGIRELNGQDESAAAARRREESIGHLLSTATLEAARRVRRRLRAAKRGLQGTAR